MNPVWLPAAIPLTALLAGDIDRRLKVLIFDWEEDDNHNAMGYFETTLLDLMWRSLDNKESSASEKDRAYIARAHDETDFGEIYVDSASIETLTTIASKMKKRDSVWVNPVISLPKSELTSSIGFVPPGSKMLLSLKGINLANVEQRFGSSDPFFEVSVLADELAVEEEWRPVFKSSYLDNCLNPEWPLAEISMDELLKGGDIYRDVLISVFDWEEDDEHNQMGFFRTTVEELLDHAKAYSNEKSEVSESLFTLKDDEGNEYGTIVVAGASIKKSGSSRSLLTSPYASPLVSPAALPKLPVPSTSPVARIPNIIDENRAVSDSKEKDSDVLSDDGTGDDGAGSDEGSLQRSDGSADDPSREISGDEAVSNGNESIDGDNSQGGGDDESQSSVASIPASLQNLQEGSKFTLSLMGADLANVEGWFGCSDPFFELSTLVEGDEENWAAKYTSEHVDNNLSPIWKPATLSVDNLLDGDLQYVDLPILISIFDWEESGEHRPIGDFETTMEELVRRVEERRGTGEEVTFKLEDYDGNSQGKILVVGAIITPPSSAKSDRTLRMTLEGTELANVEGWFGTSFGGVFLKFRFISTSSFCQSIIELNFSLLKLNRLQRSILPSADTRRRCLGYSLPKRAYRELVGTKMEEGGN